jgi:outer membrane protein assembly factor BamB
VGVGHATSYDPDTGKELWTLGGLSLVPTPTPIAAGGLLYLTGGAPEEPVRPLVAVRRGARGDITPDDESSESEWIAWSQERAGSYIPSPIVYGERLYVLYDKGFLAAFDAASGEEIFEARIGRGGVTFSASPWAYDDMVFALSEEGCTFVFRAGDEYELLGTNDLDEMSLATPAIARDSLFIRTMTRLYRIGVGDASDRSREP